MATVVTEAETAWLFLAAGVVVWLWRARPRWLHPGGVNAILATQVPVGSSVAFSVDWPLLAQLGGFFAKAGAFVFASGLAIVPFLYGGVVTEHHWLSEGQFVDAVAVTMITPGPVVITVGFIGYLVAGLPGACAASLATFLPCYLFTIVPAPYFKRYGKLPALVAFVDGVTAAAIGAISGAAVVLAKRSIIDIASISATQLRCELRSTHPPIVLDVRRQPAFTEATQIICGALRRDPEQVSAWAVSLPAADAFVVYCVHGHDVSQRVAGAMIACGISARYLAGGIDAWTSAHGAMDRKPRNAATRWVTRERPKIDRIACPRLIARFVDRHAEFLYVPTACVPSTAQERDAIAYDIPDVHFSHVGERCSFDAFLAHAA